MPSDTVTFIRLKVATKGKGGGDSYVKGAVMLFGKMELNS